MTSKSFAVIGAGTVGTALGCLLARRGYTPVGVASRKLDSARRAAGRMGARTYSRHPEAVVAGARYVFITTPDEAIPTVSAALMDSGKLAPGVLLAHFSGASAWEVLNTSSAAAVHGAAIHPLYTFASVEAALKGIKSVCFSVEGDAAGVKLARQIVRTLGGKLLTLPKSMPRPLYHGAAASASNFLAALVDYSARLLEAGGLRREKALAALLPLIRATVDNIERLGPRGALTGPISRGDVTTVGAQLEALQRKMPESLPLFRALSAYTVGVAREKGTLNRQKAGELLRLLDQGNAR